MKTFFQRSDRIHDLLYVVTVIFNSPRYRSRWQLYQDFAAHMEQSGVILYTVEVAFGDRDFVVTTADNPRHVQLRTKHEIWHKECAINLGVQRLPPNWRYFAWIDADVRFVRYDWVDETLHALQHYHVVQPWREAYDLDPHGLVMQTNRSFLDCYQSRIPTPTSPSKQLGRMYRATEFIFGSKDRSMASRIRVGHPS
jgi:hypothetical protein